MLAGVFRILLVACCEREGCLAVGDSLLVDLLLDCVMVLVCCPNARSRTVRWKWAPWSLIYAGFHRPLDEFGRDSTGNVGFQNLARVLKTLLWLGGDAALGWAEMPSSHFEDATVVDVMGLLGLNRFG
ncbi:hypothetical protein ACLOJK_028541 [Asimina triloba]